MSDIRGQVARLSVDIAEKVLCRQLDDPARQEIFIAHLLDKIEKNRVGERRAAVFMFSPLTVDGDDAPP